MVLNHPFHCPTKIIEGEPFDRALSAVLRQRRFAVVTSAGWVTRGAVERLEHAGVAPPTLLLDVASNPSTDTIDSLARHIVDFDVVVALGGGSVLDAAKGALALKALGHDRGALAEHLQNGVPLPSDIALLPLIAIPTTAGTGSEVTRWGTIWGSGGAKYSITDPRLYPEAAILDPTLLRSAPRRVALAAGLDALSHSAEAVWNRRHSPLTDSLAQSAISILRTHLKPSLTEEAVTHRQQVQTAATLAGLAMGTTQTALAHSISYPFTACFGMPHGLACSFALPEIARFNLDADPQRLQPIAAAFNCEIRYIPEEIERWYDELGMTREIAAYVTPAAIDQIGDRFISPTRAGNNLREVDNLEARQIVRDALNRLTARST